MKIKCEYCGIEYDSKETKCPTCGAVNLKDAGVQGKKPRTIEELKKWYEDRKLPPYEVTRFFIGIDFPAPRAFGIYEENGEFVVYKNKGDGSRAIRYRGKDEAYAVNELYEKLKSEILNQKGVKSGAKKDDEGVLPCVFGTFGVVGVAVLGAFVNLKPYILAAIGGAVVLIIVSIIFHKITKKDFFFNAEYRIAKWCIFLLAAVLIFLPLLRYFTPKYFIYDENVYVKYQNDYYEYDYDYYDYYPVYDIPPVIESNPADYRMDKDDYAWDSDYTFEDSYYYEENFASSDSSSDSGYDWDSSYDWDSGSTDWGSDW